METRRPAWHAPFFAPTSHVTGPCARMPNPPTSNNSYQKIAFMATHAIILARKKIFTKFGHVTLRGMQARMFDFSLLKSSD
jgi:hypothetical protein